jgi:hypothetical protein
MTPTGTSAARRTDKAPARAESAAISSDAIVTETALSALLPVADANETAPSAAIP